MFALAHLLEMALILHIFGAREKSNFSSSLKQKNINFIPYLTLFELGFKANHKPLGLTPIKFTNMNGFEKNLITHETLAIGKFCSFEEKLAQLAKFLSPNYYNLKIINFLCFNFFFLKKHL
jgi:hypothetical protein